MWVRNDGSCFQMLGDVPIPRGATVEVPDHCANAVEMIPEINEVECPRNAARKPQQENPKPKPKTKTKTKTKPNAAKPKSNAAKPTTSKSKSGAQTEPPASETPEGKSEPGSEPEGSDDGVDKLLSKLETGEE